MTAMQRKIKGACLYLFIPLIVIYACTTRSSEVNSKKVAESKNDEKFDTKKDEHDAQFVVDNVSNIYGEISLSELAERHASDSEVKRVAKEVRKECGSLLNGLKKYADKKAISIPTGESEKEKDKIQKLSTAKTFDKDWSNELRDLNKETIDNFEKASTSLSDEELKNWVTASLPEIRKYHDKIMACNNRLN